MEERHRSRMWLRRCMIALLFLLTAPVAYCICRTKLEQRAVHLTLEKQPPGFWGCLTYPAILGGPMIVGVPTDKKSREFFLSASREVTRLLRGNPISNRQFDNVWCVPFRLINLGSTRAFSREFFMLDLGRGKGIEIQRSVPLEKGLVKTAAKYLELVEATYRMVPAGGTTDGLIMFLVPRTTPTDIELIQQVQVKIAPWGMELRRRR